MLLPSSVLDLKGLATYEVFLRGAFDKIGATPDFIHIGDYKTAINTFTQRTFTPAHREMTTSLNHDTFDQLVQAIAVARKKSPETVRALIDEGPFIAEDALAAGLVDALLYRDEVEEHVGLGDEDTPTSDYVRAPPPTFTLSARPKIAVIYAVGTIASGEEAERRHRRVGHPGSTTSTRRPTIAASRRSSCGWTARGARRSLRT